MVRTWCPWQAAWTPPVRVKSAHVRINNELYITGEKWLLPYFRSILTIGTYLMSLVMWFPGQHWVHSCPNNLRVYASIITGVSSISDLSPCMHIFHVRIRLLWHHKWICQKDEIRITYVMFMYVSVHVIRIMYVNTRNRMTFKRLLDILALACF